MSMYYGNAVAKHVRNGVAKVGPAAWVRLIATSASGGTTPLANRQWIEIQPRGGGALAIDYTTINADGTFTAPTNSANTSKILPANGTIKSEPLSDKIMMWGRFVVKNNTSHGGLKVIVTEYA